VKKNRPRARRKQDFSPAALRREIGERERAIREWEAIKTAARQAMDDARGRDYYRDVVVEATILPGNITYVERDDDAKSQAMVGYGATIERGEGEIRRESRRIEELTRLLEPAELDGARRVLEAIDYLNGPACVPADVVKATRDGRIFTNSPLTSRAELVEAIASGRCPCARCTGERERTEPRAIPPDATPDQRSGIEHMNDLARNMPEQQKQRVLAARFPYPLEGHTYSVFIPRPAHEEVRMFMQFEFRSVPTILSMYEEAKRKEAETRRHQGDYRGPRRRLDLSKAYDLIRDNPGWSVTRLADELRVARSTIYRNKHVKGVLEKLRENERAGASVNVQASPSTRSGKARRDRSLRQRDGSR